MVIFIFKVNTSTVRKQPKTSKSHCIFRHQKGWWEKVWGLRQSLLEFLIHIRLASAIFPTDCTSETNSLGSSSLQNQNQKVYKSSSKPRYSTEKPATYMRMYTLNSKYDCRIKNVKLRTTCDHRILTNGITKAEILQDWDGQRKFQRGNACHEEPTGFREARRLMVMSMLNYRKDTSPLEVSGKQIKISCVIFFITF